MSIFKTKASVKRGLFSLLLCIAKVAQADGHINKEPNQYWSRLLHASNGVSSVISDEFFLTPNGRFDLETEQNAFISMLSTDLGHQVACNFPARYKWVKRERLTTTEIDLSTCVALVEFRKKFQQHDFYLGYVTEFLDSPASAFGHLMLVFSDPKIPLDLSDVIHFAANSNGEKGLNYIAKGLTGGFRGYYVRDPFFKKANEYLVVEQRAIHLLKIELTPDQIENLVLHIYELRKAEFKYYFIDENCAFQLANFLDIAVPEKSYGFAPNQPVLPIDVVRRNQNRIVQHLSFSPTHKRVNEIASTLSDSELSEVKAVLAQEILPNPESTDAVKELISLQYQYAFRRLRKPYPNHAEVDSLDFKKSTNYEKVDDSLELPTRKFGISTGLVSTANRNLARLEISPMGWIGDNSPKNRESQLEVLTTSFDVSNDQLKLNELKMLNIRSTPNALEVNKPWSWGLGISMNRYNFLGDLAKEGEFYGGKTFVLQSVRTELSVGLGAQSLHGFHPYSTEKASILYQFSDTVSLGISTENKRFSTDTYRISTIFMSINRWEIRRKQLSNGIYENYLSFSWSL
jgi:hypothetical protein